MILQLIKPGRQFIDYLINKINVESQLNNRQKAKEIFVRIAVFLIGAYFYNVLRIWKDDILFSAGGDVSPVSKITVAVLTVLIYNWTQKSLKKIRIDVLLRNTFYAFVGLFLLQVILIPSIAPFIQLSEAKSILIAQLWKNWFTIRLPLIIAPIFRWDDILTVVNQLGLMAAIGAIIKSWIAFIFKGLFYYIIALPINYLVNMLSLPIKVILSAWTALLFGATAEIYGSLLLTTLIFGIFNVITKNSEEARLIAPYITLASGLSLTLSGLRFIIFNIKSVKNFMKITIFGGFKMKLLFLLIELGVLCYCFSLCVDFFAKNNNQALEDSLFKLDNNQNKNIGLVDSLILLSKNKILVNLAVVVLLYGVTMNIFEQLFKTVAKLVIVDRDAYKALLSTQMLIQSILMILFFGDIRNTLVNTSRKYLIMITPIVLGIFSTAICFIVPGLIPDFIKANVAMIVMRSFYIIGLIYILAQLVLVKSLTEKAYSVVKSACLMYISYLLLSIIRSQNINLFNLTGMQLGMSSFVVMGIVQAFMAKMSKYTSFDNMKERSYVNVPLTLRTPGKAAVEMIGGRVGKALGGWINSLLIVTFGGPITLSSYQRVVNHAGQSAILGVLFSVIMYIFFIRLYAANKEVEAKLQETENELTVTSNLNSVKEKTFIKSNQTILKNPQVISNATEVNSEITKGDDVDLNDLVVTDSNNSNNIDNK